MRLGIHTSISGSLEAAALKAAELGANTFQIFSSSPRMWRASLPDAADVRRLHAARERFDLRPLAIHVNYLVNLASLNREIRAKSTEAFRGELERAAKIGAEFLVVHPGSYKGGTIEESIDAFARALAESARGVRARGVTVLIENTAASSSGLPRSMPAK